MASNREERKLMRQRGAASRQVQEVDFGFSFGSPLVEAPAEPPQPPLSSQGSSRKDTTPRPRLSRPSLPRSQRTPVRTGEQVSRGTPGSARSGLSQTSVYDIPDDGPEQRSPKRRKLSVVTESYEKVIIQGDIHVDTEPAQTTPEGFQEPTTNGAINPTPSPAPPTPEASPGVSKHPSPEHSLSNGESPRIPDALDRAVDEAGGDKEDTAAEDDGHKNKPVTAPQRKRKKRKSVVLKPKRKSAAKLTQPQQATSSPAQGETTIANENNETPAENPSSPPTPPKQSTRRRGQKQKTVRQSSARPSRTSNADPEPGLQQEPDTDEPRESPPIDQAFETSTREVEGHSNEGQVPDTIEDATEDVDREAEEVSVQQEEEEPDQHDPEGPAVRKRRKAAQTKTTTAPRKQPGRRRRSSEAPGDAAQESPEAAEQEEQEEQPEPAAGRNQARRQPRERKPRGETVPVVVHRLANLDALDVDLDEESPDESRPSDDRSSGYNIPSRGGANAADVLSQICRETLEKTMSTLENSISQESNQARRAEWTRKRKAVEAFSTELGHRLFGMSEIMESNFVLAAQLKKERKEMATLRNRLLEVRKERREMALQIDDVRRKYTEEEQVNREQDTLNNSLHNLQLALDRSHKGKEYSTDTQPFVGLEFLLRTVAQDVSSVAPDSQGGLLNQVRNFNTQLESILKEK